MPISRPIKISDEQREEFHPSRRALVAAVFAVAATYFYFLIFAQFGFLKALQAVVGGEGGLLQPIMAVMGGCGIAGSIGVALLFSERLGRPLMLGGFGLAGAAAGLSLIVRSPAGLLACAALTGAGTGIITVALAAILRREVGGEKLGICIGAGTGLAYALCNLPFIFNAGGDAQAVMGIVACCAGWLAMEGFEQRAPRHLVEGMDYRRGSIAGWVTVFFALVWLDSAAFYLIQHAPLLKIGTWGGDAQLYLNAFVHAVAALLAGLMLDRRLVSWTVLAASGFLVLACLMIGSGPGTFAPGAFFYTAGVSFYSTALVFYPARCGRVGLAALVYAVAGWGGSALGIGMAKRLGGISGWSPVVIGTLILGVFLLRTWIGRREKGILFGGALALLALGWPQGDLTAQEKVETGRKVYLAEGCIHCHSQYVRPGTGDERLWGRARPLAEALAQTPPLLGNRRQGPDLQNVALRRTREWNRRHLMAPRTLIPGSRMPSYRYLFRDDAAGGEALLDYLASLGLEKPAVEARAGPSR